MLIYFKKSIFINVLFRRFKVSRQPFSKKSIFVVYFISHFFVFYFMRYFITLLLIFFITQVKATHVMGGEITWKCQGGGSYVFELTFYRDCNGAEVNTVAETIEVWNHPSVTQIQVLFASRTDISPFCTPVAGSPLALACGTGTAGGNGIGAFEKIVYRSNAVTLPGAPPAIGWIFTAKNFSRSTAITNLVNPSNYGITISAYMFPIAGATTGCIDSSPRFLQEPNLVSCAGSPYVYNMNAVDIDLDSISISFGHPLNDFSGVFNPPSNPILLPYEAGFNANSPTPDLSFNPGNIPANIDPQTGELTFTSNTVGNFVVKMVAKSFRNGQLIAQVEREMQIVNMNCIPGNNPPVIAGPFGGLFETTINAGDLVNFTLASTDVELLQDGSPQNNILTASGLMFGTNQTSTTGCGTIPCATLNNPTPTTSVQGSSTTFNWQTSCDHLVNQYGIVAQEVPYHFVFKVQDNFCQVPKVTYATVTIHVKNKGIVQPPQINCIQTAANGNLTIQWTPPLDPTNSFDSYRIRRLNAPVIATINNLATNSYTVTGVTGIESFYIETVSGCDGNVVLSSDTVQNIQLTLVNPSNGTAVLNWNQPVTPYNANLNEYYHILREYPVGIWSVIDSVAYGTNAYKDTIDICNAFLNYQIVLPTTTCSFTSNIEGDTFEDMITPNIPEISSVTIDTLTGDVNISWDENDQSDTFGYIIYQTDQNGVLFELDTVYGINNTTYNFGPNTGNGSVTFSIAAFDSCFTNTVPVTFQTSAKSPLHTTMFTKYTYDVCGQIAKITWSKYLGWTNVNRYEIYGNIAGVGWNLYGTTTQTFFQTPITGSGNYQFVIRAVNDAGIESFSNQISVVAILPSAPAFNYTRVATVDQNSVTIKHYMQVVGGVKELSLERKNKNNLFVQIAKQTVANELTTFIDSEVNTDRFNYEYRVRIIDSCGNAGIVANEVKTILLEIQSNEIQMINTLNWNAYEGFNGSITKYNIFRSLNGTYTWPPLATVSANTLFYQDDLNGIANFEGKICYYVEAIESMNVYHFSEQSKSNEVCTVFEPLIYIPNAFTPGGLNPIFIPVVSLINPQDYRLTIIDRWGQVMFYTTDIFEGWDGTMGINHKLAETGMYMYVLQVRDGAGQEVTKRGHVSLLK